MKTFHLTRVTQRNDKHHVFLTWGKSFEFSQHRQALRFLTTTNTFLTAFLVELNDHLSDVQVRYRKNWLLFFHDKPTHGPNNYADDRTCDHCIDAVKELLNIAFNRHKFDSGSSMAFENFRKSLDYLVEVCRVLLKYYKRYSWTVDVWQINILISKLQARKLELDAWGLDSATKMHVKMSIAFQQVIPLNFSHKLASVS